MGVVGLDHVQVVAPRGCETEARRFYGTLLGLEKAVILLERLARNHPLPDGNKRTAFFLTGLFLEANGAPLCGAQPDVDVPMVERIAAGQVERRGSWRGCRSAPLE